MNRITDHILFATNFSDACHAAIPAVTRWVDAHNARLTILHVYQPEKTLHRQAEAQLESFYAEAENYKNCRRVLLSGNISDSIENFCAREGDGLLFIPPSDRIGLPRPFHVSTRARLLRNLDMPIWTMGKASLQTNASVAGNNIAVCVQDLDQPVDYVHVAAAHAQRHGAALHLMHVVPETSEGTLISALHSNAPLGVESTRINASVSVWEDYVVAPTRLCEFPIHGRNQEANDYREAPHQRSDVEKYQPISGPIID